MEFLNVTAFGSKSSFRKNPHRTMTHLSSKDSSNFQKIFPKYIVEPKGPCRMAVLYVVTHLDETEIFSVSLAVPLHTTSEISLPKPLLLTNFSMA